MEPIIYKELLTDAIDAANGCAPGGMAILGESDVCEQLIADLRAEGAMASLGPVVHWSAADISATDRAALATPCVEVVVIASDRDKEPMIRSLPSLVSGTPRVLFGGYAHFEYS